MEWVAGGGAQDLPVQSWGTHSGYTSFQPVVPLQPAAPSPVAWQVPEAGEKKDAFRRLALVPDNLFPTSSCVGGCGASPGSPRASHYPSTRPHSLLVCVVKSSQYSSPESVNSSAHAVFTSLLKEDRRAKSGDEMSYHSRASPSCHVETPSLE